MEQEDAGVQVPSSRRELLVTAYLRLTVPDLDALPIHVHEWFLEQMQLT